MSLTEINTPAARAAAPRASAHVDFDLLRTLVAIADTGSFNRASRQVHRTPSAVSMQMKKLEEQVGRALFVKDGRSVTLTPDGESLVSYGRRILKLSEEALSRFHAPQMEGTIRLGAPDDYAGKFLPDILARFSASHPNVEVDVSCQPSAVLLKELEENLVDVALVSAGTSPRSAHIVHREALVWAGLRHGTAHEKRPVPLALAHVGCCWRGACLEALQQAGIPYRIAYSSRHYTGQLAAVLAGLAIAPVPRSSIDGDLRMVGEEAGLPPIGFYEIELRRSAEATGPILEALELHIENSFRSFGAMAA